MNIRKFVGANSRDALRLVREALGPDAAVLSNRTLEDGTVEIVAMADSDLAALSPKAHQAHTNALNAAPRQMNAPQARPAAQPAMAAAPRAPMAGNPYSGDVPDVFSSVFGASPEAGADPQAEVQAAALPAASRDINLGRESASVAQASQAFDSHFAAATADDHDDAGFDDEADTRVTLGAAATAAAAAAGITTHHHASANTAARRLTDDIRIDGIKRAAPQAQPQAAARQQTMADTNPWLIDHARRIVDEQQNPRAQAMSPSAAMARGMGTAVDVSKAANHANATQAAPSRMMERANERAHERMNERTAETPEWAREAAQLAARRAAVAKAAAARAAAAQAAPATDEKRITDAVAEVLQTRMKSLVNETVMNELASMRGMMEEHFAGLLWGDRQRKNPMRATLTKQLFAAGFSAQLTQMVVDNLPDDVDTMDAGMDWVRTVLASNLPVMEDEDALMEKGGVFALMGPTGVGKTTTTAKLAARCVMRFGANRVALLTTDSYRIGGHEQLRIFGKILGVSVHAVKDGADLELALGELRNKHIVLIDTIGMSQRDRLVSEQIAMLTKAGHPVQRLLLLNATSHGDTLNEVVQAYQHAPDGQPLAGCILTKLDESTNLGGVLDTVIRYKLRVHYVSTGQKVPENLYVATRKFLIKSAFCVPRDDSPFVPQDDEIPGLLSALTARSTAELHEVNFG